MGSEREGGSDGRAKTREESGDEEKRNEGDGWMERIMTKDDDEVER